MTIEFLQCERLPNLYIDALVTDENHKLLFLSAWGSESYVKQTRAAAALSQGEGAFDKMFPQPICGTTSASYPRVVYLGDRNCLEDAVGRPTGHTLLTHLTQLWIYDRLVLSHDFANSRCLLLQRHGADQAVFDQRIWQAIQTLSRIPLHSSWVHLVSVFKERSWVKLLPGFGVNACKIELPEADVEAYVTEEIQQGRLTLPTVH